MKDNTIDIHHALVADLKRGSQSAATQLYGMYAKAMYNILTRLTGDDIIAQDLLQDAFVKAFDKISKYRGDATFGAWLKRIVINTGLEHIRRKKLSFESLDDHHEVEEEEEPMEFDPGLVHGEIKNLPDGARAVLTLYLLEGYSHKEIADELDISVSTSKTQFMRARQQLKENLKHKIYE